MIDTLREILRYLRLMAFSGLGLRTRSRAALQRSGEQPVYVSLSTTPDRISKISPTIASLVDQTQPLSKVFLCIAKKSRGGQTYKIPSFLSNHPLVEVRWVERDLGPATKWFYILSADDISDGSSIIVLDDDQVYPKRMVEHYLNCKQQFPKAAFTLLGWQVPATLHHKDRHCVSSGRVRLFGADDRNKVTRAPQRVHCMQGASSFLLTKGMLRPTSDYFEKYEAANFADDILISGLLAASGVPVYVLPGPFQFVRLHSLRLMRAPSLYNSTNRGSDYNDQLYRLFEKSWPAV